MNTYEAPNMELEEIEMNNVLMSSGVSVPADENWGDENQNPTQNSEL